MRQSSSSPQTTQCAYRAPRCFGSCHSLDGTHTTRVILTAWSSKVALNMDVNRAAVQRLDGPTTPWSMRTTYPSKPRRLETTASSGEEAIIRVITAGLIPIRHCFQNGVSGFHISRKVRQRAQQITRPKVLWTPFIPQWIQRTSQRISRPFGHQWIRPICRQITQSLIIHLWIPLICPQLSRRFIRRLIQPLIEAMRTLRHHLPRWI
mmetsp:Transcript_12798/g.20352  ORF Transcript_12798/g.20352 Transcript_12798/m.20352 type:complete len:207 (+) Transcript_12798:330-950(+)